jgi:hypothetical protein
VNRGVRDDMERDCSRCRREDGRKLRVQLGLRYLDWICAQHGWLEVRKKRACGGSVLDAKLDALEAFRQLIYKLLLDRAIRGHGRGHIWIRLGQSSRVNGVGERRGWRWTGEAQSGKKMVL